MKSAKNEKQVHDFFSIAIVLTMASIVGLGLITMSNVISDNGPLINSVTGKSIYGTDMSLKPTTEGTLGACSEIYLDYVAWCADAFDENDNKVGCLKDAKNDCYSCVLSTKDAQEIHLGEYCYK